jgi:DNA modification methylase
VRTNYCFEGDNRETMRQMIADGYAGKIQTIITSPPYWGLRDYGVAGQLGQEPTLREFLANMVEVFELCRQLLADDGTLWLNMGDSYAGSGRGGNPAGPTSTLQGGLASQEASRVKRTRNDVSSSQRKNCPQVKGSRLPAGLHAKQVEAGALGRAWVPPPEGFKNKDLIGQPFRLAFALQDAGWYLRQDIIWHKPNPMPESVTDRCTKAHEYLFLLTKNERYYFDQEAILEPVSPNTHARLSQDVQNQIGSTRANGGGQDQRQHDGRRPCARKCKFPERASGLRGGRQQTQNEGWSARLRKACEEPREKQRLDGCRTGDHAGQAQQAQRLDRPDREFQRSSLRHISPSVGRALHSRRQSAGRHRV